MNSTELQTLFSSNLKAARIRLHLSQMKLAEKADLSVGYICDLESGRRWGTPETFTRLANALEIEPYALLLPVSADEAFSEEERALSEKIKHLYLNRLGDALKDNINKAVSKAVSNTLASAGLDKKSSNP